MRLCSVTCVWTGGGRWWRLQNIHDTAPRGRRQPPFATADAAVAGRLEPGPLETSLHSGGWSARPSTLSTLRLVAFSPGRHTTRDQTTLSERKFIYCVRHAAARARSLRALSASQYLATVGALGESHRGARGSEHIDSERRMGQSASSRGPPCHAWCHESLAQLSSIACAESFTTGLGAALRTT